jgi:hypothetical protein
MSNLRKQVPVGPGNFWNNILSTVMFLILIMAAFSYSGTEPEARRTHTLTGSRAGEGW